MVAAAEPDNYVTSVNNSTGITKIDIIASQHDAFGLYGLNVKRVGGVLVYNENNTSKVCINVPYMTTALDAFGDLIGASEIINGYVYDEKGTYFATIDDANLFAGSGTFGMSNVGLTLKKYIGDLSNLKLGDQLFENCNKLATVIIHLSSLVQATSMFSNCVLSAESVMYIADGIKDWGTTPTDPHNITIDVDASLTSDEEVAGYLTEIANKGWTVATNHTAYATAAISEQSTSGVYAIARPAAQERATHVTTDGKYVAVESAVSVIGPHVSQWSIYPSVEDAIMDMELTAI